MCWQWHLMDHCILAQLTCCPQLKYIYPMLTDFPVGNGCGKHAGMNSIYYPSHNAVHENMGFAPSTVVWPCFSATWHSYNFGSRFLVTAWSQILQLLQTGAEIWAQFYSCPGCLLHQVRCWWCWSKLKFSGCPNTFNGMGDFANTLLGRTRLGGILL